MDKQIEFYRNKLAYEMDPSDLFHALEAGENIIPVKSSNTSSLCQSWNLTQFRSKPELLPSLWWYKHSTIVQTSIIENSNCVLKVCRVNCTSKCSYNLKNTHVAPTSDGCIPNRFQTGFRFPAGWGGCSGSLFCSTTSCCKIIESSWVLIAASSAKFLMVGLKAHYWYCLHTQPST